MKTFAKKNKTDLPAPLTFANKSFAPENVTNSEAAVFKNLG